MSAVVNSIFEKWLQDFSAIPVYTCVYIILYRLTLSLTGTRHQSSSITQSTAPGRRSLRMSYLPMADFSHLLWPSLPRPMGRRYIHLQTEVLLLLEVRCIDNSGYSSSDYACNWNSSKGVYTWKISQRSPGPAYIRHVSLHYGYSLM